jgi:hypothetical protein
VTLLTNDDLAPRGTLDELCGCGKRRGLHRYGDEACPNPAWKPCNGQPEFQKHMAFHPRAPLPWRPS